VVVFICEDIVAEIYIIIVREIIEMLHICWNILSENICLRSRIHTKVEEMVAGRFIAKRKGRFVANTNSFRPLLKAFVVVFGAISNYSRTHTHIACRVSVKQDGHRLDKKAFLQEGCRSSLDARKRMLSTQE